MGRRSCSCPRYAVASESILVFLRVRFFVLTRARIESYSRVWRRDGVRAQAAIRRDGRAARGATLKRTLNLVDVEVVSVEEALAQVEAGKAGYSRMIIESSEPGSPGFEFRNV